MDPLARLAQELHGRDVRFLVIGVAGANYWAVSGADLFSTRDRDLLLPLDPDSLLRAWDACAAVGLEVLSGLEPLELPRSRQLAERVIERRASTRATNHVDLEVDFTLVMAGFDFETVWAGRREFTVDGVEIPVARLMHIVASKQKAGREKDRLFLATHRQTLDDLLGPQRSAPSGPRLIARRVDITALDVDAIVNAANTALAPGGGVCGAIHRAAGPELAEACRRVAPCPTGEARITPGFRLPAAFVIHAVGPVWHGGGQGEVALLASAYRSSVALAREQGLRTIAFPAISTGIFGFPLDQATRIAVQTVREETGHGSPIVEVVFACFSDDVLAAYRAVGIED